MPPPTARFRKGTLASVVGAVAAAGLLMSTPLLESGRSVDVAISPDGVANVRHVSGKQYLTAYLDIAGVPTACDGITKGVKPGLRFTPAECAAKLEAELVEHAGGVMACSPALRGARRDQQRVAVVLLAYNVGVARWCQSTAHRLFEAGDFKAGCDAFRLFGKARVNGQLRPVAGLMRRREYERQICLRGL